MIKSPIFHFFQKTSKYLNDRLLSGKFIQLQSSLFANLFNWNIKSGAKPGISVLFWIQCSTHAILCWVGQQMEKLWKYLRDRRQIMANLADWLVDSYFNWKLIGLFKNVTICILRRTEKCLSHFWRTNQFFDDVTSNQSIGWISHILVTIYQENDI